MDKQYVFCYTRPSQTGRDIDSLWKGRRGLPTWLLKFNQLDSASKREVEQELSRFGYVKYR